MHDFFWSAGHLGWGIFALAVFTGLGWLAADLVWRTTNTRAMKWLAVAVTGWIIGAGLIVLGCWLAGR